MAGHPIPDSVYDILIVGGGPAGFTAGLYVARAELKALLIEGASTVSQITTTDMVENYPGIPEAVDGFDLVGRFRKQALQFGLETLSDDITAIEKSGRQDIPCWKVSAGGKYYDAPFYRHREVVVVGGGDTAIEEALFLTRFADKVTIVHRRDRLRATGVLQKRAFANSKIAFAWKSVVEKIQGKDGVEAISIRDVETGDTRNIPAHGIFIFIGLIPNTELFQEVVALAADGSITVNRDMMTSTPGLFACGDCTDKLLRQVVTACGDGATAAYSAQLYVEELKGEAY
jgi:thioredoxin reductase (NADPH)